jgi:hypothetical protein
MIIAKPKQKNRLTFINNLFFIIYPKFIKRNDKKTEINPKRISVVRIKTS